VGRARACQPIINVIRRPRLQKWVRDQLEHPGASRPLSIRTYRDNMVIIRLTIVAVLTAFRLAVVDAVVNVTHYAPSNNNINNLTFALSGTGAPGIFNSSNTPDAEYGIYNWCNMPHVRTREYKYVPRVSILPNHSSTDNCFCSLQQDTSPVFQIGVR
jgi:hypothetical protein